MLTIINSSTLLPERPNFLSFNFQPHRLRSEDDLRWYQDGPQRIFGGAERDGGGVGGERGGNGEFSCENGKPG